MTCLALSQNNILNFQEITSSVDIRMIALFNTALMEREYGKKDGGKWEFKNLPEEQREKIKELARQVSHGRA